MDNRLSVNLLEAIQHFETDHSSGFKGEVIELFSLVF
jgi:hypothetical protein